MTSANREGTARTLRAWIPAAAYMALILGMSSIPRLAPPGRIPHLDKLVHLGEYGVLGLLLARGFAGAPGITGRRLIAITVLVGSAFAALDEIYQGTVPGRNKDAVDWAADTLGLLLGAVLFARLRAPRSDAAEGKR